MRDYRGIDIEGKNKIASLDALTYDQLKIVTNMYWRAVCGRDVIFNTYQNE